MKVIVPHLPSRYDQATKQRIPSIDINPAADWGTLSILVGTETAVSTETLQENVERVKAAAVNELGPKDHILCIGDLTLTALVIATSLTKFGRASVLRWDKRAERYTAVEIKA